MELRPAWSSSCSAIDAVKEAQAVPGRKGSSSPASVGGSTQRPVGHSEISPVHQTWPFVAVPLKGTCSKLKPWRKTSLVNDSSSVGLLGSPRQGV